MKEERSMLTDTNFPVRSKNKFLMWAENAAAVNLSPFLFYERIRGNGLLTKIYRFSEIVPISLQG